MAKINAFEIFFFIQQATSAPFEKIFKDLFQIFRVKLCGFSKQHFLEFLTQPPVSPLSDDFAKLKLCVLCTVYTQKSRTRLVFFPKMLNIPKVILQQVES